MKIETKYDVGDKVFCLLRDIIVCGTIAEINATAGEGTTHHYLLRYATTPKDKVYSRYECDRYEYDLFPTIADLLENLKSNFNKTAVSDIYGGDK